MLTQTKRKRQILMVEDNPADARLMDEVLKDSKYLTRLHWCENGELALDFLHKRGEYQTAPDPDLIVLDLNLPGIDGKDILQHIRDDPSLTHLPVIIFTTSRSEVDILKSYALHASSYIVKPIDYAEFEKAISLVESFWMGLAQLPNKNP